MKGGRWAFAAITLIVALTLTVLTAAGLDALLHLKHPYLSIAHRLHEQSLLAGWLPFTPPDGPDWPEITDERQILPYFEAFKANGVGLGNSPYEELVTDKAAINHVVDGCLQMKPDLRKTVSFMNSELFNTFDPVSYFYDTDRKLPDNVQQFLDRYTFRKVHITSNENGERVTLPLVQSADKILVAGDSMGLSLMLDDDESLASRLQALDPTHQYINIGINGASARDVVCALERAAKRYAGQIRGVIYPFCENDLQKNGQLSSPDSIIARLVKFKTENGIRDFTIIYMPLIHNSVPELTRIPGNVGFDWPRHGTEKKRLLELAAQAGFRHLDYTEIARAEQQAAGSQYAALALFVDRVHLSRLGIRRLVDWLMSPPD